MSIYQPIDEIENLIIKNHMIDQSIKINTEKLPLQYHPVMYQDFIDIQYLF